MSSIPLVRILTDAGYGSRRDVSQLIKAGLVQVNGVIATSYTTLVDPGVDSIAVTGNTLQQGATRRVYLMMNKPDGYLCTTEDDRDRPTVFDLLPQDARTFGLHPAGRLDEDSTGLLILTNDGQVTYQLTHPRFEHEKEYWIATTGRLTDADIELLETGVEIEGQVTWPARVRILLGESPYTYSITIHEGRKRQVRMMLAAIGQQVALLKRVRLGGLFLGDLPEGEWRALSAAEVKELLRKRPVAIRQSGVGHGPQRVQSIEGNAFRLVKNAGAPSRGRSQATRATFRHGDSGEPRGQATPQQPHFRGTPHAGFSPTRDVRPAVPSPVRETHRPYSAPARQPRHQGPGHESYERRSFRPGPERSDRGPRDERGRQTPRYRESGVQGRPEGIRGQRYAPDRAAGLNEMRSAPPRPPYHRPTPRAGMIDFERAPRRTIGAGEKQSRPRQPGSRWQPPGSPTERRGSDSYNRRQTGTGGPGGGRRAPFRQAGDASQRPRPPARRGDARSPDTSPSTERRRRGERH